MVSALAPRALAAAAALGVVTAIAIGSCTIDRRTIPCATSSDCSGGRVCEQGLCVLDPNTCPSACKSCNVTSDPPQCTIADPASPNVACPAGMHCDVLCDVAGECGTIDCSRALSCTIACTATGACGTITCGSGRCDVSCNTSGACADVACASSCRCDVGCNSGNCGTLSCPRQPTGSSFCTTGGSDGEPCRSAVDSCRRC